MLHAAHQRGVQTALATFGIKNAGWLPSLTGVRKFFIGESPEIIGALRSKGLKEGLGGLFKKDQLLHHSNVFWPTVPGSTAKTWMGRGFGTILPAIGVAQALRGHGDPNEGVLANTLGSLGSAAGFAYGSPAVGMLGAPILAGLGHHAGKTIGRMLGSHPKPPLPPPPPPEQPPQMYAPPTEYPYSGSGPYAGGF